MSYRYFKTKSIDLYNNPDYIAAYIGLNFVAFLNNKREIVMDIEDREAIEILEDIQREEIPKLSFFPVYDGKTFTDLDVKNKMVAHDVFGYFSRLRYIFPYSGKTNPYGNTGQSGKAADGRANGRGRE